MLREREEISGDFRGFDEDLGVDDEELELENNEGVRKSARIRENGEKKKNLNSKD